MDLDWEVGKLGAMFRESKKWVFEEVIKLGHFARFFSFPGKIRRQYHIDSCLLSLSVHLLYGLTGLWAFYNPLEGPPKLHGLQNGLRTFQIYEGVYSLKMSFLTNV